MTDTKMLPKLSLKVIQGMGRTVDANTTKAHFLALAKAKTEVGVFAGKIEGYIKKTTDLGDNILLIGGFMAINRSTGELFESDKLYLPKGMVETLVGKFDAREKGETSLKFKLSVLVVEDSDSVTGYTYISQAPETAELINERAERLASLTNLPAPKSLAAKVAGGKK
jgi:hypothetical protein